MEEKNVIKLNDDEMFAVTGGYDEAIVPEVTVPLQAFDPSASSEITNPPGEMEKIFKGMEEPDVEEKIEGNDN